MSYINEKLQKFNESINGKKIAIIGLGVSNRPLLDYLVKYGAKLSVFDNNEIQNIDKKVIEKIKKNKIECFFGKNNLSNLIGFDIIFRSPSCMPNTPELKKEIRRGASVTTEIEMVLKLSPSKIIGITGTEGKTTTTSIIYEIVKEKGYKCYIGGNIGTPLFNKIQEMMPEDIVILELSSFQLIDMEISPQIAVVTNIFPEHLNIHKTYEEYKQAKKNIFKFQSKEDIIVLNKDNEITYSFADEAIGRKIFFSSKLQLKDGYVYEEKDETIKFCKNGKCRTLLRKKDIKLRGVHNFENVCTALAATSSIVDVDTQIKAIKNFIGVEHRLEFVRELNGVKYYNDSIGTSPPSTIAGLNSFDEKIVLIAGGSDKGLDYTEIGDAIVNNVTVLVLAGPTSEKIQKAVEQAMDKLNKRIKIYNCKNLEEQVKTAKENAEKGDVVLLSPASASFDSFKNFMERGNRFKELVHDL